MSVIDFHMLSHLYLGAPKNYPGELVELARLCCKRHDSIVANEFTEGRAAEGQIDSYYAEAMRLGFEGSRVMWRRYVVGKREIEL